MKKLFKFLFAISIPVILVYGIGTFLYAGDPGDIASFGQTGVNEVIINSNGDLHLQYGLIRMIEITDPANPPANYGLLYINDVAATTSLMFRDSAGTETNLLTVGAGVTLDGAYDQGGAGAGRTITVDSGDVELNLAVAASSLELDSSAAGVTVTDALSIVTTGVGAVITDAIDASDADIVNAINIGANAIAGTNFSVTGAGAITSVGIASSGANTFTESVTVGADGVGHDVTINTDTAGDTFVFNDAERTLYLTDCEIQLDDGSTLNIGSGTGIGAGDYAITYSATNMVISASADVASQTIVFGDDTNDLDLLWEGDVNNQIVRFDSSANIVYFDGIDLNLEDNDSLLLGDGAANNGDWSLTSPGAAALNLVAIANNAGAVITIGTATEHADFTWQSGTAGDLVTFDWDNTVITQTDVGTAITDSTAFADNIGALVVTTSGNKAAGGNTVRIVQTAGVPDVDSRLLELVGTGLDQRGIFADVDGATNTVYTLHSGGAVAAGMSVLAVTADGTPAAATSRIASITFTGVDANVPVGLQIEGTGTGIDITGLGMATESNGTTAWNMNLVNAADDALGVSLRTHHISATPAAADEIFFHTIVGEDSGGGDTEYVRLSAQSLLPTAASEDGEYIISVAADNGTLTQALVVGPQLNSANTGISVGSGAATGAVTSEGAFDLLLQTNYGTSSSNITITDGLAGNITFNMDTTGLVRIASTDGGAVGSQLTMAQAGGSQIATDVVSRIIFGGQDDAAATESYARIDVVVNDPTALNPDGAMLFYVDVAGTLTERLRLDETIAGIGIGSGAATAILESQGSFDLQLQTGNATTGTITLTDGASGNLTVDLNAAGETRIIGEETDADEFRQYISGIYRYEWEHTDPDGSNDIVLWAAASPECTIVRAWVDMTTAEGAAMTITLRDAIAAGGNAITNAMDANVSTISNATTLGSNELAAGATLVANFSGNPGTAVGVIFVEVIYEE